MDRVLKHRFTFEQQLDLYKRLACRTCEVAFEQIIRDHPNVGDLDEIDELYLRAYCSELCHRVVDACQSDRISCPPNTLSDLQTQVRLIVKHDPNMAQAFPLASSTLKEDVMQRLESFKRRVGDAFVSRFKETVDRHEIKSPIEQIFLMEWQHHQVEERFDVELAPQAPIECSGGSFVLDFLISSKSDSARKVQIGIELDGHEFHQKTKEQVTRDRQRDRAIMHSGITVLRFSGSEIVMKTSKCIAEVLDFLRLD